MLRAQNADGARRALTRGWLPVATLPLVSAAALPSAARQGATDYSGASKARPRVVLRRVQALLGTVAPLWRPRQHRLRFEFRRAQSAHVASISPIRFKCPG